MKICHKCPCNRFLYQESLSAPNARCEEYPWLSPYAFCAGNPIRFTDRTGQRIKVYDEEQVEWEYIKKDGQYEFFNKNGDPYSGSSELMYQLYNALDKITSGPVGAALVDAIAQSDEIVTITGPNNKSSSSKSKDISSSFNYNTNTITWNFHDKNGGPTLSLDLFDFSSKPRPSYISLAHELGHAFDSLYGSKDNGVWFSNGKNTTLKLEIFAGEIENLIRQEQGIAHRKAYISSEKGILPVNNGFYDFATSLFSKNKSFFRTIKK